MTVNKTINLAKALQKYYLHKGNRIIFANKMTLNQLAMVMWERLGFREVDSSVLSRVISGERLFTQRQLRAFCEILKIKGLEKSYLKDILLGEIYQKFKLLPDFQGSVFYNEIVEGLLKKVSEFRLKGDPHLAAELTDLLLGEVRKNLGKSTYDYYGRLLLEAYFNGSVFLPHQQIVARQQPLIKEIKTLAEITKRKDFLGLYHFAKGGAYYDQAKYDLSLPEIEEAQKYIKWSNVKYEIARQKILNLAQLKLVSRFNRACDSLNQNEKPASLLDGIGRAQGLLKMPQAFRTLDDVEKIYHRNKDHDVYRLIQLTRSRMEVIRSLEPNDKNHFEKLGKEGLKLATQHGYKRYAAKIREMLNSIL